MCVFFFFFTKVPFNAKKYFFIHSSVPFQNFSFATLLSEHPEINLVSLKSLAISYRAIVRTCLFIPFSTF